MTLGFCTLSCGLHDVKPGEPKRHSQRTGCRVGYIAEAQSRVRITGCASAAKATSAVSRPPVTKTTGGPKACVAQPARANPTGNSPNDPTESMLTTRPSCSLGTIDCSELVHTKWPASKAAPLI